MAYPRWMVTRFPRTPRNSPKYSGTSCTLLHSTHYRAELTVSATPPQQVIPFYPGEDGSLSFSSNIVLDGSKPHIREIYFAGEGDATYQGGDVVQVTIACVQNLTPSLRVVPFSSVPSF